MIDILFAVIVLIAIVKGYRKGLILALFSIVAFIVGLAAALKLSAAVAVYLQHNVAIPGRWLPTVSFILVFLVVIILVNLGGKLIEKSIEMVLLGWANRLAGILLFAMLYTIIFSIFLFYAEKMSLLEPTAFQQSQVYPFIKPWGSIAINGLGSIFPFFKNSFTQLELFFDTLSKKI